MHGLPSNHLSRRVVPAALAVLLALAGLAVLVAWLVLRNQPSAYDRYTSCVADAAVSGESIPKMCTPPPMSPRG